MVKECSLCGNQGNYIFSQKLLNKYDVKCFRCERCDLIQTEAVYWFNEACAPVISSLDTGAVWRNISSANMVLCLSWILGLGPTSRCLDYGGGYGVLVRLMRDNGLNFRYWDKYSSNIFSVGFEGEPTEKYDLVTCFEVFEHLTEVSKELSHLFLPQHNFILVSTLLHAGHKDGWWYYCPESGRHVSFFSKQTMEYIGRRFGYVAICGWSYTLLIKQDVSLSRWRQILVERILTGSRLASILLAIRPKYNSLISPDYIILRDALERSENKTQADF
jgi:hypothetical protein